MCKFLESKRCPYQTFKTNKHFWASTSLSSMAKWQSYYRGELMKVLTPSCERPNGNTEARATIGREDCVLYLWMENEPCLWGIHSGKPPYKVIRGTQKTSHGHERSVGFQQLSFRIVSSSQHPLRSSLWSCPDETSLFPLMLSTSFPPLQMPAHIPELAFRTLQEAASQYYPFGPVSQYVPATCLRSAFLALLPFPASAFAHCSACCPLSLSPLNKMVRPG